METVKVGMREFRENLAGYLESGRPLAIMRHGETLGFYIPAQKRSRKAQVEERLKWKRCALRQKTLMR
jgi:hypothetical protein